MAGDTQDPPPSRAGVQRVRGENDHQEFIDAHPIQGIQPMFLLQHERSQHAREIKQKPDMPVRTF